LNYRPDLHGGRPRDTRPFPHAASAQHAESAPDKHNSPTKRTRRQGIAGPRWNEWHLQAASGSSIRNVVPRPTSEVKSIEPLGAKDLSDWTGSLIFRPRVAVRFETWCPGQPPK
jgi:hypothetical protein